MAAAGGWAVAVPLKERQTPTAASCYAAADVLDKWNKARNANIHGSCWWVGCAAPLQDVPPLPAIAILLLPC
jgi:hypothetical protein